MHLFAFVVLGSLVGNLLYTDRYHGRELIGPFKYL